MSAGLAVPEGRFEKGMKDNRAQTDTVSIIPRPNLTLQDQLRLVATSQN